MEIDANFDYVSEIERDVLDQKMGMNFINVNLIDYIKVLNRSRRKGGS